MIIASRSINRIRDDADLISRLRQENSPGLLDRLKGVNVDGDRDREASYDSGQNATDFKAGTCAMNVQISADLSRFVEGLVADGKYQNGDQVFAEGLRLLQAREPLRRDVEAGIAQLDRGEGLDEDDVFEVLDRRIAEIERAEVD
jgi:antitoxin ParD1/3/4